MREPYLGNDFDGRLTNEELKWLFQQATKMDIVVQIGSYHGRGTHALCSGCGYEVWAFDTWDAPGKSNVFDFLAFIGNVWEFVNLKWRIWPPTTACHFFPDKGVDMVFIDPDVLYQHRQDSCLKLQSDIAQWIPKTRKLICGHDHSDRCPEVKEAVSTALGNYDVFKEIWYKWL